MYVIMMDKNLIAIIITLIIAIALFITAVFVHVSKPGKIALYTISGVSMAACGVLAYKHIYGH